MASVARSEAGKPVPILATILGVALALRVAAALFVHGYVRRLGKPCLFGDTLIYGALARTIREGTPFVVDQSGQPHFALRTPGYPAFLAACQVAFGSDYLPVRLVQAVLGTIGVYIVYRLVARVVPDGGRSALIAAGLAAVEPYGVGIGALILSEGAFIPLMLAGLLGLAVLWRGPGGILTNFPPSPLEGEGRGEGWGGPAGEPPPPDRPPTLTLPLKGGGNQKMRGLVALITGLIHGSAILTRPSWALIVPILLAAWVLGTEKVHRREAFRLALLTALATSAVMAPWWVRNARIFGRFVPTALWVGASLYDGISPAANGASEMTFLEAPDVVGLDEETQDAVLKRRSIDFAVNNPARVAWLAIVKAGRFWSPWPNADTLQSRPAAVGSALVTIPLFALVAIGAWDRRRDLRAMALLAGPLVYFLALHMVFVSSIRYRIPGFLPALGLAAVGCRRLWPAVSDRIRA